MWVVIQSEESGSDVFAFPADAETFVKGQGRPWHGPKGKVYCPALGTVEVGCTAAVVLRPEPPEGANTSLFDLQRSPVFKFLSRVEDEGVNVWTRPMFGRPVRVKVPYYSSNESPAVEGCGRNFAPVGTHTRGESAIPQEELDAKNKWLMIRDGYEMLHEALNPIVPVPILPGWDSEWYQAQIKEPSWEEAQDLRGRLTALAQVMKALGPMLDLDKSRTGT